MSAEIRLRARRRVGELSAALEPAPNQHARSSAGTSKSEALEAAGLSRSEAHRCEQLARVQVAKFEAGSRAVVASTCLEEARRSEVG